MPTSFWHLDIGNVATWLALACAALGFMWRFSRRIDLIEDSQKSGTLTLQKLAEMVERMNSSGTNWSREKLASETLLQQDHSRRLIDLEKAFQDQSPKIATLVSDVNWIKHHIQRNGSSHA